MVIVVLLAAGAGAAILPRFTPGGAGLSADNPVIDA